MPLFFFFAFFVFYLDGLCGLWILSFKTVSFCFLLHQGYAPLPPKGGYKHHIMSKFRLGGTWGQLKGSGLLIQPQLYVQIGRLFLFPVTPFL